MNIAKMGVAERIKAKESAKRAFGAVKRHIHLAVASGQEHKLGRWWRMKEAKNQVVVVQLEI